ncbi:cytochrome P450 CYP82D47-like [Euphorbia lathyris]|uniref:cytochrome P450 CYP82D47-like n=1 Tax=Euphorbia lathyris TaxID=212925 RepID=UPI0033143DD6
MDLFSNLLAISGVIALLLLIKLWKRPHHNEKMAKLVPEIPGGIPILGHMHLLRDKQNLGRIFGGFADKYGPIFSVRLGKCRAVFISDKPGIKDCFINNDINIASRPPSTQAQFLGYDNSSFGFAPYGRFWRDIRKLATVELLSGRRIKMLNYIPISELNHLMRDLYNNSTGNNGSFKVDITESFQRMVLNTITRMVAGKRVFDGNHLAEKAKGRNLSHIIRELLDVTGQIVPGDVIPFIAWLDIKGVVKTMKNVCDEVGTLVDKWIEEHKMNTNKNEDEKDFIDVMLSEVTNYEEMGLDQSAIIKGTATSIIIGASDTTAISITWILSNLMNHPKVLKRCQEELDLKVGKDRIVQVEDIEKLEYLSAVIKETLRLYPAGPIGTPRIVTEDCYMSGYFVPKGCYLFINIWKVHRDPNLWSNPEEFKPERFLNEKAHLDITGNSYEYLPFSAGRRSCPGNYFAMHIMNLSLARFLQGFNVATPNNQPVDMTEGQNIVMQKEYNLELVLTPRLDPKLYELDCN